MSIPRPLPTAEVEGPHEGRRCRALVVAPGGPPKGRPIYPFEVIGIFDPDGPPPHSGPGGFRHNGTFLHFLNWVIAVEGPSVARLKEAALQIGDGLVQVIDGRAALTRADVEPETRDIIGAFDVKGGKVGVYRTNFAYRPLTERGLIELDDELCDRLLERLASQVAIEMKRDGMGPTGHGDQLIQ